MNKYELCVVLNPQFEGDSLKEELDRVTGVVTRFGGEIEKIDEWGRRKLAYEIQKLTEGVYYFINFDAPPEAPAQIEDRLRIAEPVIRFLIVRVED